MTEQLTTELTDAQRTEVRLTLLQSIAEMGRGLKIMGLLLKKGMMGTARDQIGTVEAMLTVHESMAILLLRENTRLAKENARLEALILDADSMLQERTVTLDGTAQRMLEQAMLPKAQRGEDFDRDDLIRYGAYAAESQGVLSRFRRIIAGQG